MRPDQTTAPAREQPQFPPPALGALSRLVLEVPHHRLWTRLLCKPLRFGHRSPPGTALSMTDPPPGASPRRLRDSEPSFLAQHEIDNPAPADVRTLPAAVREDVIVVTPGVRPHVTCRSGTRATPSE